jgi:hypothetical protein
MVRDGPMILEILLGAIFVGGGGVLVWLGKVHVDDVRHARAEEAEFERLRLEEERLEDERRREEQRLIAERRLEQERQRLEQERLAEERRREQERQRLEQARLAEVQRREQERLEQERLAAEHRREEERRREQERQRLEQARLAEERRREQERLEQERLSQERLLEERRRVQEILEQERLAEEHRREEENLAAQRRQGYERLAEERRREQERLEQERLAEERRREQERLEQERLAEERRREQERRRLEQERLEKVRLAEERRRDQEILEQARLAAKRLREEERLTLEGRFEHFRAVARHRREEERLALQRRLEQEKEAAQRCLEEERLAAEHRHNEISRIGGLIYKEFSDRGATSFNVRSFAALQGLALGDVTEAGLRLYRGMVREAVSNKEFTSQRKVQLDWIARALEIDMSEVAEIETQAKIPVFLAAFKQAISDMKLAAEGLAELETVRKSISLRLEDASEIMIREGGREVYFVLIESTIDTVQADAARRDLLRSLRRQLFKDWETTFASPEQVNPLYRKAVALVLQDGIVEDQEREFLEWLRDEIRPSQREIEECGSWIESVAKLADYRSGRLPTVPTTYLLEGGELCHFVGSYCFFGDGRRGEMGLRGDLVVTDRKIRFLSNDKSTSIKPSQIMDVTTKGKMIYLMTDTRRGRIKLLVSDPGEIEAILIGVARKNKYAVNYASTTSRHIPQHIKTAVWSRDGGRCVKCGIDHALQFDHIIPFAEGGASTVDNLQILCSPCNLQKGDRI